VEPLEAEQRRGEAATAVVWDGGARSLWVRVVGSAPTSGGPGLPHIPRTLRAARK
jgi:hypothetical protein